MTAFGAFLSREEHPPLALVDQAVRAEAAGFNEVWSGQIGPEPEGRFDFWEGELRPALDGL